MNFKRSQLVALVVVLASFGWAFAPSFLELRGRWDQDQQYSHGYLVPLFAVVLLWLRRDKLQGLPLQPARSGLLLLGAGLLLRLYGAYYHYGWYEDLSILPCVAGICVTALGWSSLKWSWPAVAFLLFMIPLPFRLEKALAHPLQQVATVASTYLLQTMGVPAMAEGNVIVLSEAKIGVVEACSGLSMLLVFFALSSAVALFMQKPLWERLFVVASAIPIAIIANVTRITLTGLLHELLGSETADAFFHGPAGWFMIPFALGLLWVELKILGWLLIPPTEHMPLTLQSTPEANGAASPVPRERAATAKEKETVGEPQ